jgi:hypothetical protein
MVWNTHVGTLAATIWRTWAPASLPPITVIGSQSNSCNAFALLSAYLAAAYMRKARPFWSSRRS